MKASAKALEIGICLFPSTSAQEAASLARLCEDSGLAFVGIGDVQTLWRDLYVTTTLVATHTERIRFGPWVTNPVTRHPTVTANAVLTLQDLSNGRVFLGIGVGDGAVAPVGSKPATLDELSKAVGQMYESFRAAGQPVKVYWAATGPRSLAYAAANADGIIVSGWIVPEVMEKTHAAIADGLARARRRAGEVELIFNTAVSISLDRRSAIEAAKPYVARALARSSSTWLPDWSERDMLQFKERYDYARHFTAEQQLKALVPDHMVTRKAVAGSPEDCLEIISRIRASGFDKIALIPVADVRGVLQLFGAAILPHI